MFNCICNVYVQTGFWWHMPLTLSPGMKGQADLCEFRVSLFYKVNSRRARTARQRKLVLKNKNKTQNNNNNDNRNNNVYVCNVLACE